MKGRNKCKILKQIRQKIADENDIPYVTRECTYRGECRGTCPKCEQELRYLEQELEKRRRLGKTVAVAAVAATLSLSLAGCAAGGSTETTAPRESETQTETAEVPELMGEETATESETAEAREWMGMIALPPETETEFELVGDVEYIPYTDSTETEAAPETTEVSHD